MMLVLAAGCASAGPTLTSGPGQRLLDTPPYYAGSRRLPPPESVAHVPIEYQAGATRTTVPGAADPDLIALVREMNGYLDTLRGEPSLRVASTDRAIAPDVRFGCQLAPVGGCGSDDRDVGSSRQRWLSLAVDPPSPFWIEAADQALEQAGKKNLLVIRLEVGEYWSYEATGSGVNEVRLGTGHVQEVPWLTCADQPVPVLQLTGVLVDQEGRVVRLGAEGLVARRANIFVAALGGRAPIGDADIASLMWQRRHELSGDPYTWQVALENLVRQLTGEGVMR